MNTATKNYTKRSLLVSIVAGIITVFFAQQSAFAQQSDNETQTWAEKLGYPVGKRVVILHADDIGMCEEANISAKNI